MKPLAIDLCCGLGGWSEGLIAEGWDVVGFDVERHKYGAHEYPAQLVLQDIRTLTGQQFRGSVSLIVASPPCTEYSWMAMPWKRAKQVAAALRGESDFPEGYRGSRTIADLNALFDACVRIGKEAQCQILIENVRGAQPWVGRARWMYGSFALWGDVPALMPPVAKAVKVSTMGAGWYPPDHPKHVPGLAFNTHADRALKGAGPKWDPATKSGAHGMTRWTNPAETGGKGRNPDGRKGAGGSWMGGPYNPSQHGGNTPSGSTARKFASAMIAKIPLPLSRHIASTYYPRATTGAAA